MRVTIYPQQWNILMQYFQSTVDRQYFIFLDRGGQREPLHALLGRAWATQTVEISWTEREHLELALQDIKDQKPKLWQICKDVLEK